MLHKLRLKIIHFHTQNPMEMFLVISWALFRWDDGLMARQGRPFCIFNNYLWKKSYCQCVYTSINWNYLFKVQNSLCSPVVKGRCVMLFKQVRVNHVDDSVAPENRRRRISFSIPLIKSANLKRNNVLLMLVGFLKYHLHQWHVFIK